MNFTRPFAVLCFCFGISAISAQKEPGENQGIFSFGISLSDYNSSNHSKDSSAYNTIPKGLFKAGNGSFGVEASYWKPLLPHIDFSGNLGGNFSNFPAGFVKGDSIGQASFSMHMDALLHIKAFAENARINPFVTAGAGVGFFGKQTALYAPLGAGVSFHFSAGPILILQAQIREALSGSIANNFMFYSVSLAQGISLSPQKKEKSHKNEITKETLTTRKKKQSAHSVKIPENKPAEKDTAKASSVITADTTMQKNNTEETKKIIAINPSPDSDGDSIPDKDDKCPNIKGSRENQGCPFPVIEGVTPIAMSADSVTYVINFDFDHSELGAGSFAVLNSIVRILQSDKSLTIHISGYTDSSGTDARNMQISYNRARVTRNYFLSYNIAPSRITSSYYGSANPIDMTEQWRNRRAEITIIKH